ncbi:hypothetical protein [Desulfofundulus thermosubterraneus]|uniref:PrcB C-terminal n=1 Tax=Desulfofundulus thermosubterraneus DSM 16057 TaxID=1121432 RepID=A0A1M6DES0_9FIRM|nr:hypothetical protein [Desulfofundulus thermosubterraneus]SHI71814.1 hypothetical protein SAMN02745219_00887 [Desulfofundulus thermosubterraneus DSM 16057]
MRTAVLSFLLLITIVLAGCSRDTGQANHGQLPGTPDGQDQRFKIIYEHSETKNLGGFTVLRDNATGHEYLIITGLNGAPTVVPLQRPVTTDQLGGKTTSLEPGLLSTAR